MKIHHFGNTANNALHNVLIFNTYSQNHAVLPIKMFGLAHAISAPAWELGNFVVPSSQWVENPNWNAFPEAAQINKYFSDLPHSSGNTEMSDVNAIEQQMVSPNFKQTIGRLIANSPFHQLFNNLLVKRSIHSSVPINLGKNDICIIYGADSLLKTRPPRQMNQVVSLEHGTIRWIANGADSDIEWRKMYTKQVQKSRHLWVTNLDPKTLELAEDVMPGRWTALPHPFMLSEKVPFQEDTLFRQLILQNTKSDFLVLLPSSQNWGKHHDKGSMKALEAFVQLRSQGINVGLVAAEWGLQLQESKEYLHKAGVDDYVYWVSPMSRFKLQQMMANVDVVWDQFGLDAFGALALRALEQGVPLISRGLKPEGVRVIGTQVPWMIAETSDQISALTTSLFADMGSRSRSSVIFEIQQKYRGWLIRHHNPAMTVAIQENLYSNLLEHDNIFEMPTDVWANYKTEA